MADLSMPQTTGGQKTAAVIAGVGAADVVVTAVPGRVCKLVVTTAGTATLELYDHATASSGAKLVWKSVATPAVGTIYVLDIPLQYGLVAKQANGSAAITAFYTEDGVSGAVADKSLATTSGGQHSSYHAAGAPGASVASAVPGRLCKISVLSAGSAVTNFYDHATAASGVKVYTLVGTPTVGDVIEIQAPLTAGLFVAGATNTSAVLVTYSKDTPLGR